MTNKMEEITNKYCSAVCDNIMRFTDTTNLHFWNIFDAYLLFKVARNNNNAQQNEAAENILDSFLSNYNYMAEKNMKDIALTAYIIKELIEQEYCEGDTNEIMESNDHDVIKTIVKDCEYENISSFVFPLFYLYVRLQMNCNTNQMKQEIICEAISFILNRCAKVKTEYLYHLIQDTECNIMDDVYVYLNLLVALAEKNIYSEKIFRMLGEYESVLVSLIPQLIYNKLLYIITLSRIGTVIHSPLIAKHMQAITNTLNIEQLKKDFKPKDYRSRVGFIPRLFILKKVHSDKLLNETMHNATQECLLEIEKEAETILNELIPLINNDGQIGKVLRIKEYAKLGIDLCMLNTRHY